jgi:hypothetical protein
VIPISQRRNSANNYWIAPQKTRNKAIYLMNWTLVGKKWHYNYFAALDQQREKTFGTSMEIYAKILDALIFILLK